MLSVLFDNYTCKVGVVSILYITILARSMFIKYCTISLLTVLWFLVQQHYVTENLRMGMQEYFEERNNGLHSTLQNIDENLNKASEAHSLVSSYRAQLLDACNDKMQPATTVTDGPILVRK